jgi:hypothetical protein
MIFSFPLEKELSIQKTGTEKADFRFECLIDWFELSKRQ